jgi:hypothetical protein
MAKQEKETMKDRIVKYMETFGSITTMEAFADLGCTRLSEYIRQIRMEREVNSETIHAKNRFGEPVWYCKFTLGKVYVKN